MGMSTTWSTVVKVCCILTYFWQKYGIYISLLTVLTNSIIVTEKIAVLILAKHTQVIFFNEFIRPLWIRKGVYMYFILYQGTHFKHQLFTISVQDENLYIQ